MTVRDLLPKLYFTLTTAVIWCKPKACTWTPPEASINRSAWRPIFVDRWRTPSEEAAEGQHRRHR